MYNLTTDFQWDENKNLANNHKHGIDFHTATELWNDTQRVEITAPYPLENRSILIGRIDKQYWTAIFTRRDNTIRIISVRRSRKREVILYEQKEVSK